MIAEYSRTWKPALYVFLPLLCLISAVAHAQPSFTPTGSLATGHESHTATLLLNGKVLVTGGDNGIVPLASAELYDPAAGAWTNTGSLATARKWHTATLLPNGKVLVTGGDSNSGVTLASAELYDLAAGTWTATGSLTSTRQYHTATLLPNGNVLVTGGVTSGSSFASAELYYFGLGIPLTSNLPVPFTLMAGTVNGLFTLKFTNVIGATFSVETTTNPALPTASWALVGVATELAPGQFQFPDPQPTTSSARFYRVRSP